MPRWPRLHCSRARASSGSPCLRPPETNTRRRRTSVASRRSSIGSPRPRRLRKERAKTPPVPMVESDRRKDDRDDRHIGTGTRRGHDPGATRCDARRRVHGRRRRLRGGVRHLERRSRRPPAGAGRSLQRRGRRDRRSRLRAESRPADRRPRRWPQRRRLLDVRRRNRDRSRRPEGRSGRPRRAACVRRRRRNLGGRRPRDDRARPRDDRRPDLDDRRRRIDARGRDRLADAQARPCLRQPPRRRRRDGGRAPRAYERNGEPRVAARPARRRRQLRDRDGARAGGSPGRPDRLRGTDLLPGRGRRRPVACFPRVGAGRSRRHHRPDRPDDRTTAAGDPGGMARSQGLGVHRHVGRPDGGVPP